MGAKEQVRAPIARPRSVEFWFLAGAGFGLTVGVVATIGFGLGLAGTTPPSNSRWCFDNGSADDATDPLAPVRLMAMESALPGFGSFEHWGYERAMELGVWTRADVASILQRKVTECSATYGRVLPFDNGAGDDGTDPLSRDVLGVLLYLGKLPTEGSWEYQAYQAAIDSGELESRSDLLRALLGQPVSAGRSRVVPAATPTTVAGLRASSQAQEVPRDPTPLERRKPQKEHTDPPGH